jgi:hypothetical protein
VGKTAPRRISFRERLVLLNLLATLHILLRFNAFASSQLSSTEELSALATRKRLVDPTPAWFTVTYDHRNVSRSFHASI